MSKKISLILAALGLSTGLAFAQQSGDSQLSDPSQLEKPPASSLTQPESKSMSEAAGTIAEQDANQIRAQELIGVKAVNHDQKLGQVEDLLLERDGKIAGVVLSVGGIFGIGDKLVAVPWKQVKVTTGNDPALFIAMNEAQLKAAPQFEPAKSAGSASSGLAPETQKR